MLGISTEEAGAGALFAIVVAQVVMLLRSVSGGRIMIDSSVGFRVDSLKMLSVRRRCSYKETTSNKCPISCSVVPIAIFNMDWIGYVMKLTKNYSTSL